MLFRFPFWGQDKILSPKEILGKERVYFIEQFQIIEGSQNRNLWVIDMPQEPWRMLLAVFSWTYLYFITQLLCDTIPREIRTNINSPQTGNEQQTKVRDHQSPSQCTNESIGLHLKAWVKRSLREQNWELCNSKKL